MCISNNGKPLTDDEKVYLITLVVGSISFGGWQSSFCAALWFFFAGLLATGLVEFLGQHISEGVKNETV